MEGICLQVGQAVAWAAAPGGIAQIEELRRRRVRLVYRCKNGKHRHPVIRVEQVAQLPALLIPMVNPLDRGVLPRSKSYELSQPTGGAR